MTTPKMPREGQIVRLRTGQGKAMPIGSKHAITRVSVTGRMIAVRHPIDGHNVWLSLSEVEL